MIPKMTVTAALTLWMLHTRGGSWSVGDLAEKLAPGSSHLVRTGLNQLKRFHLARKVQFSANVGPQMWEAAGDDRRIAEVLDHYHDAMVATSHYYRTFTRNLQ